MDHSLVHYFLRQKRKREFEFEKENPEKSYMQLNKITVLFNWEEEKHRKRPSQIKQYEIPRKTRLSETLSSKNSIIKAIFKMNMKKV